MKKISTIALIGLLFSCGQHSNLQASEFSGCTSRIAEVAILECTSLIDGADLSPQSLAFAYYHRGISYAKTGEYDFAIADYTEAIRLNPNLVDAHVNRVIAYVHEGDHDLDYDDYTEACELIPQSVVLEWQSSLERQGYYTNTVDGICGPSTINAIGWCVSAKCIFWE